MMEERLAGNNATQYSHPEAVLLHQLIDLFLLFLFVFEEK